MASKDRLEILIVDDSPTMRRIVRHLFADVPDMEVVGAARNGKMALDLVAGLAPDALVLDVDMPVMDGFTALEILRKDHPALPVVMFTTVNLSNIERGMRLLSMPHTSWVAKPQPGTPEAEVREQLVTRLRQLAGKPDPRPAAALPAKPAPLQIKPASDDPFEIIAVGASTGGPDALTHFLRGIPRGFPLPVVITLHIPVGFTQHLAARLDGVSSLNVQEGTDGQTLQPGCAYLAPGGRHMTFQRSGVDVVIRTDDGPLVHSCRPAVDPMFHSVSRIFGSRACAVVLTGMGADGTEGCGVIRAAGGYVLIQDEATSVVWGMPGSVHRAGYANDELPLSSISGEVARLVYHRKRRDPGTSTAVRESQR